jgi:hypothetical protein
MCAPPVGIVTSFYLKYIKYPNFISETFIV